MGSSLIEFEIYMLWVLVVLLQILPRGSRAYFFLMTDIISVETTDFGGEQVQAVDARVLFVFLGLTKNYTRWCKNNIWENKFALENIDYITVTHEESSSFDVFLSIDFAKRISMTTRTEK